MAHKKVTRATADRAFRFASELEAFAARLDQDGYEDAAREFRQARDMCSQASVTLDHAMCARATMRVS